LAGFSLAGLSLLAMAKSGVVHTVQVDIGGQGVAYLSGHRVEGGETVTLAAGKHLLQHQVDGAWVSELVWVEQGATIDI
jgi:hypothetical protein